MSTLDRAPALALAALCALAAGCGSYEYAETRAMPYESEGAGDAGSDWNGGPLAQATPDRSPRAPEATRAPGSIEAGDDEPPVEPEPEGKAGETAVEPGRSKAT